MTQSRKGGGGHPPQGKYDRTIVPPAVNGAALTRTENQDRTRKLDIPIELSIKVKQKPEKIPITLATE